MPSALRPRFPAASVTLRRLFLVVGIVLAHAAPVFAAAICSTFPPRQPMPAETIPQFLEDANWRARLAQLNQELAATDLSRVRLVFLGDSITASWMPLLFQQFYGHRGVSNLGITGDSTQGMLWRLPKSPLGGALRPRLIVLLIGTNDLWPGAHAEDVALGIAEVVRQIHQLSPQSQILLVGLLPRGADAANPLRQIEAQVNQLIARCADGVTISYTDPGALLVDGRGQLSDQIAFDYLHPTWLGYAILAAGLEPYVHKLLDE
jgi:lysophospholipase L1-like esterase